MIKRFFKGLRSLSLIQQLVTIVLTGIIVFFMFATMYINNNIDSFVREQLFSMIKTNQSNVITESKVSSNYEFLRYNSDKTIGHAIYSTNTDYFVYNDAFIGDNDIINNLKERCLNQVEDSKNYVIEQNDAEYLCTVTKISKYDYLISCLSNAYRDSFREAAVTTLYTSTIVGFCFVFFILLAWVLYLIVTLTQVKIYVDKIKRGEKATLKLDRGDEIGELADAIVTMNDEITKQQKTKEELIQNISHDLKTPIATIKSYAESIKDGIYPYDSLEKSVDVIIEHSERLEKKVQNLLLLNKMGYLEANDQTGSCDMEKVIEKVLLSIKVIRPEIEIEKETIPAVFFGDEEPWRVVVENLMDNALRYAKSNIIIRLTENELSVENDGPFMTQDRIDKLFKPYEKGTDGKFGLGLSIVYKVCTTYKCEVYAYNTHDGVAFKIKGPKKKKKK